VLDMARTIDLQSLPLVRAIFRARERLMRVAPAEVPRRADGLVAEMVSLGWGLLVDDPGHRVVLGARCQPWRGDVTFSAIRPEAFATYAEPDQVKIAWTLEVEWLGPARGSSTRRAWSPPTTRPVADFFVTGVGRASAS